MSLHERTSFLSSFNFGYIGGAHLTRIKVPDSDRNVLIYIVDINMGVSFFDAPEAGIFVSGACFAGMFRGVFRASLLK